jgi:type I restriction enzyme S subunit
VRVPLAPSAEQTRIVAKLEELLSDLDAGVAELKAAQAKLAQYRQSLLKAAVEGALTADWRARRAALETDRPAQPAEAKNRPRPAGFHASFAAGQRRRHETPPTGGCAVQEDGADGLETGAQLLARILTERRARWETRQLARFQSQGKTPPKGWHSKYPEPVAPDTRDLPELPEGWVWATIGQCFQVAVGATPSRKIATYWKGEIPWVSSGEVQFRRITSTKESITKDGLNNSSTQVNPAGSVLLGMIGEGKTRGQVAILDTPAANNQNCAAIWVSETDVPPEYVYFWLWSRYNQTRKGSSGNNQPALNKSIVERIPISLPPFREIREIVALLETQFSSIDKEADAIAHLLAQSAAQRQNLLKAAFSGQLVPQDPNDEPASVLLERIRALQPARASRGRKKVTA